jgi:hypothetical protein
MATVALFGLSALWSLATPIDATNDEGAQVMKAASVVRGELLGATLTPASTHSFKHQIAGVLYCEGFLRRTGVTGEAAVNQCVKPYTIVTIPRRFVAWPGGSVCNGFPPLPDSCPTHLQGANGSVKAITYDGRYPPLYYAIVGLPSLVSQTDAAVYAMRFVSGALTALLLGLAIALAARWSSNKMLLLAVTVAATPLVLAFGSTVNPSGLEMSAALCAWTGALVLVLEHAHRPPTGLVIACAASSVALVFSRPLSALWLAIIAVSVAALRPSAIRSLAANHRVRIAFACVAVAAVAAVAYVFWAKSLSLLPFATPVSPKTSELTVIEQALGATRSWIDQYSGAFGWGFALPPLVGTLLLGIATCAVFLGGLLTGERRMVAVLGVLIVVAIFLPVLIDVSQARKVGFDWTARYSYPLYCGVVVVAGAITQMFLARQQSPSPALGRAVRRLIVLVACCVAGSQLADVLWAIRRYTVGLSGPLNIFAHVPGGYSPPIPILLLVVGALGFCGLYGLMIVGLGLRSTAPLATLAEPSEDLLHPVVI